MTWLLRSGGPAAALVALAAGLTGCGAGGTPAAPAHSSAAAGTSSTRVEGSAPTLVSATSTDDVDAAAGSWSTTWKACFAPVDGAAVVGWQVQTLTSEGTSPRIEQLPGPCVELQVAHGTGTPADGPARIAALSDAASLVYRVRAERTDGSVTPWTGPVAAGTSR
ncbi:hypothetical protein [Blastococcus deserti]|uniref:LppP/LprE lipoprotein n=1 Tax=Blastococcus deserti TaxID=2259033 RepID=A0ABW4XBD0_9ACTN